MNIFSFNNSFRRWLRKWREPRFGGQTVKHWWADFYRGQEIDQALFCTAIALADDRPVKQAFGPVDLLSCHLDASNEYSQALSALGLSLLPVVPRQNMDQLIIDLDHYDEMVRRCSALTLTLIGTLECLIPVIAGTKHGKGIRNRATACLSEMGPEAAPAIPALIKLLEYRHIHPKTHWLAASVLSKIGPAAKAPLIELLDHEDEEVAFNAASALSELEPEP
ncbi:MAG: hypothetical protein AAF705_20005 [Bacteroidota bacterium]